MKATIIKCTFWVFLFAGIGHPLSGQQQPVYRVGLMEFDSFFQRQRVEVDKWVGSNLPKAQYRTSEIRTDPGRVTLMLQYQGRDGCGGAQNHWAQAEGIHTDLGSRLVKHWAFLAEVEAQQAVVEIKCCSKGHFQRRFTLPSVRLDARGARSGAPVYAIAPLAMQNDPQAPKSTDLSELTTVIPNSNAVEVTKKVRQFCTTKYTTLPKARYIWDAVLKFTEISDTEFQVEVTYITNVICPDGYYEYHKIYVTAQPSGQNTMLNVRLLAKYGSGIIFAPRRNDYKDMETDYKNDLAEYRNVFFKQIINAAK